MGAHTVNSPLRAPPPIRAPPPPFDPKVIGFLDVFGHISAKNSPIFILKKATGRWKCPLSDESNPLGLSSAPGALNREFTVPDK